jgi:hypothetical protein
MRKYGYANLPFTDLLYLINYSVIYIKQSSLVSSLRPKLLKQKV